MTPQRRPCTSAMSLTIKDNCNTAESHSMQKHIAVVKDARLLIKIFFLSKSYYYQLGASVRLSCGSRYLYSSYKQTLSLDYC